MRRRSLLLLPLLLLTAPAAPAQDGLPFELAIEEVAWPDPAAIPALHSFAWAEHDGRWLLITGRTDGLHGFDADPFPLAFANDRVWVVDPEAGASWSAPLDGLSEGLRESLMVTNPQFHQEGETLYVVGGYGHSAEAGTMITFPTLTAVDVPGLVEAVVSGGEIAPHLRQIEDARMAVTGGELRKMPETGGHLLIGGQRFDGVYSGAGSEFEQEYLTSIRAFDLADDGEGLALANWAVAASDPDGLHRRDLTVAPVVYPHQHSEFAYGFGIYGGVFRPDLDFPYLNPALYVEGDVPEFIVHGEFEQRFSHYTCPAVALVDAEAGRVHTTFFGGMGLYYADDDTGETVMDPRVPFIREVSTLTTAYAGPVAETLQPFEMPGFLGTNAAFIPATDVPQYEHGAFKLDEFPAEWVTVGTLYGGIEATTPNPGRFLDGGSSGPTNRAFRVRVRSLLGTASEPGAPAATPVEAAYPNPFAEAATVALRLAQPERVRVELLDVLGRRVALLHDGALGAGTRHALRLDGAALPAGLYLVRVVGETFAEVQPVTRVR